MNFMADYVMIPMQFIIFFFTVYYFVIAFFGVWRRAEEKILKPEKSFAVIVAAHNEEQVIGPLVDNLKMLNYPNSLYDIFVIADNCTDNTATIAQKNGALVFERTNHEQKGKGFAMEWMFSKLFKLEKKYDENFELSIKKIQKKQQHNLIIFLINLHIHIYLFLFTILCLVALLAIKENQKKTQKKFSIHIKRVLIKMQNLCMVE